MKLDPKLAFRLQFLARVVRKECSHAFVPTLLAAAECMIAEFEKRYWA